MQKEKLIVIIPAYEPQREFVEYAARVAEFAVELVVVNDGSGSQYDDIFEEIQKSENVKYISYEKNHGKGYALKQAFEYCAGKYDGSFACVTADCDGQHDIGDIVRVAVASLEHTDTLVLGSRDFDLPNVPKRSRVGNTNTRRIFRLLYGMNLRDTQTGLRGFSVKLAKQFLLVKGDRFEYEMNMLIYAKKNGISVLEVPIETIYPDNPEDHVSHFKTVRDSIRVLGVLMGNLNYYIISSILSGIVDVFIFYMLSGVVLGEISAINTLIATISARVASSLLNFTLNRKYVFAGKSKTSIIRYYILWFCQLGASYGLVFLFGNVLGLPMTPMKLAGDLLLAFLSYQIQQNWVFKNYTGARFYGSLAAFIRFLARVFTPKYKSEVFTPDEPTVYVCRHLDMHGPLTTLARLDFHVHPMVLSCFFDKKECYKQYSEFTFTERRGIKKKKYNLKIFIASRFVPLVMKSLRGIPVHRGTDVNAVKTMRDSLEYLEKGESVIVYPDIQYTAGYETESEIYEGFLLLGQIYKRKTGKSLRFVPLYIDENDRVIKEYRFVTADNFRENHAQVAAYIKSAINGKEDRGEYETQVVAAKCLKSS